MLSVQHKAGAARFLPPGATNGAGVANLSLPEVADLKLKAYTVLNSIV